jgi:hypothetical protein
MQKLNYWQFIEHEARRIGADGCTGVSEWHQPCCFEHDLACRYGRNPRSAYAFYWANPDCAFWAYAETMSRRQADSMFASCNYEWSVSTGARCRSFVRYLGVRLGALLGIGTRKPKA